MSKLLEVENLKTHFQTQDGVVKAVDGVSFSLDSGETLAIVGESGSGKSVTAMSIMRLVQQPQGRIVDGDIRFKGESLVTADDEKIRSLRGNRIAMVFQDPMTSLNPVFRVGAQIGESLRVHRNMSKQEAEARAIELLELVGIPNPGARAKDYPHQFSGGMRQRAMIAMALACDPDILIADEPTTALDVTIQAQITDLMLELQRRTNSAIIMITHDLGVVADMADNVLVMYAGRMVEYGTADQVFYEPRHPYTWGLLDSLPRHDVDEKGELCPIKGQPPSLIDIPAGCAFGPRCPYAGPECTGETPQAVDVGGGHMVACVRTAEEQFRRELVECAGTEEVAS